jgi:hypothetical protein
VPEFHPRPLIAALSHVGINDKETTRASQYGHAVGLLKCIEHCADMLLPIAHGDDVRVCGRKSALLLASRIDLDVHRDCIQPVVSKAQDFLLDVHWVAGHQPDIMGAVCCGLLRGGLRPRGLRSWCVDDGFERASGVGRLHYLSLGLMEKNFTRNERGAGESE